jgi:hypothetical protein
MQLVEAQRTLDAERRRAAVPTTCISYQNDVPDVRAQDQRAEMNLKLEEVQAQVREYDAIRDSQEHY